MKAYIVLVTAFVITKVASGADMPGFPFVFVEGYATKNVAPDMAEINFNLEASSVTSTDAMSTIDEQSKQLLKYFSEQKIQSSDIRANRIEKEALQSNERDSLRKILGYKASRHFSVTVRDLSRYVDIAQKVFSSTKIVWASTDFDSSNKKGVEAELLVQACQNARERASQLANGFGSKLGPIQAITQRDFFNIAGMFGLGAEESSGRSISFESQLEGIAEEHRVLYVPASITFNNGVMAIFCIEFDTK